MSKKVYVGMSGGVDSSLTAALLVEAGYNVTGIYMKNWSKDIAGFNCPWREDLTDAKRVAVQLGIDFKVFDFEQQYKQKVVDYMLEAYGLGLTPNPDIMCNQEIKFKVFLDAAKADGADMIATGHYARVDKGKTSYRLLKGKDDNKDQSYFLYRITEEALSSTLFPLGELTKPQVRKMAKDRKLITADKKESMGICFVGKVGIKDFLKEYVDVAPGKIIDQNGEKVGVHDGALFYTIGQRHGLDVGGGLPYYVVGKDVKANTITVSTDLDDKRLWLDKVKLVSTHWINSPPTTDVEYQVRSRHRAPLVNARVISLDGDKATVELKQSIRAVTAGQSLVIYQKDRVIGGGIVSG